VVAVLVSANCSACSGSMSPEPKLSPRPVFSRQRDPCGASRVRERRCWPLLSSGGDVGRAVDRRRISATAPRVLERGRQIEGPAPVRLPAIVGSILVKPVMLPPGRGKLATKPLPTGSETITKTMGMVRVCCCKLAVVGVLCETMRSGCSAISSFANRCINAASDAAQRMSMRTLRPPPTRASEAPCGTPRRGPVLLGRSRQATSIRRSAAYARPQVIRKAAAIGRIRSSRARVMICRGRRFRRPTLPGESAVTSAASRHRRCAVNSSGRRRFAEGKRDAVSHHQFHHQSVEHHLSSKSKTHEPGIAQSSRLYPGRNSANRWFQRITSLLV
jgi:hypothetical protein